MQRLKAIIEAHETLADVVLGVAFAIVIFAIAAITFISVALPIL
jgi:hypothetical protein